jgi:two-component system NtrC family sensor kinase
MSGELILVIDDSKEIVRHLADQVLPMFGFRTLVAFDGRMGWNMIRQERPDLIMLDLNLPEMTGMDVLQAMVEDSIRIPVILMTGYGSEKSAVEAFRLGVKDYLVKPFTVDEVIETINRSLIEVRLRHDKQELTEQLRLAHVEMRRRVNEMGTLFGIGKAVASLLDVDKVLERVLEAALYLSNGELGTIWLLDPTSNELRVRARKGSADETAHSVNLAVKDTQVGQVMQSGRPLRQSLFSGKGIEVKTGYLARAILYVPLILHGQAMGVLGVSNHSGPRAFSERDEFLLSALADYAAIALENARVFQATDRALAVGMDELRTLIQITRTITSSLDLDEVVRTTIRQVHDSWKIEASSLWLLDESGQSLSVLANVGTPADILQKIEVPVGRGFVGHVAQTGKWIYTNNVASHPLHYVEVDRQTGFKTRSLLCVPLTFRGRLIGALQLLNKLDGEFDDQDVERAISIATAVAIAVTNALLFQQAESRQKQLEATLEQNSNPIIITDLDGHLLLLNQQARIRLGLNKGMVGQAADEVIQPAALSTFLTQPLEEAESRRTEVTLPDGSIWLATLAPIAAYGRILILQDISYLKELDLVKSDFVATVSHDLRAPLNSIRGLVGALGQAGPLNNQQKQVAQRIAQASQRMMELVNGLLELARVNVRAGEVREACDLHLVLLEAAADLQGHALSKGITLEINVDKANRPVRCDPTQMRRAVSNLVDNAIKYSPAGGRVQVNLIMDGQRVLVQVKDSGIGIAAEEIPHIFEKFYRAKDNNRAGGIGLGLTLVQSIAEAHNGHVWVESQPGVGSTFTLQLPAELVEPAIEEPMVEVVGDA